MGFNDLSLGLRLGGYRRRASSESTTSLNFFNGLLTASDIATGATYEGGPVSALNADGVLQSGALDVATIEGARWTGSAWSPVDDEDAELYANTLVNGKRFFADTDPLEFKRYLSMLERTNLIPYCANFSGAGWSSQGIALGATNILTPKGTLAGTEIDTNTNNEAHYIYHQLPVTEGETYTQSFYVKANGYNYVQLTPSTGFSTTNYWVNFNLSTGAVGNIGPGSAFDYGIETLDNGYSRIAITATATSTTTGRFLLIILNADTASRLPAFTGDGSGIVAWGAQFENSPYMTPLVETAGSTVTDEPTILSLSCTDFWSANNNCDITQFIPRGAGQTGWLWHSYVDADNGSGVLLTPDAITYRKTIAGVDTDCSVSYTHAANTPVRIGRVQTASGMRLKYQYWTGSAWSAWSSYTDVATDAGKADMQLASAFGVGHKNEEAQFCGHIQLIRPYASSDPDYLEAAC